MKQWLLTNIFTSRSALKEKIKTNVKVMLEKVSKAFKQMATSGLELATPRFLDT